MRKKITLWTALILGSIMPGGLIGFISGCLLQVFIEPMQIGAAGMLTIITVGILGWATLCISNIYPEDYEYLWN